MNRRLLSLLLQILIPVFVMAASGIVLASSGNREGKAPIRYGVFSEAIIPDGPESLDFKPPQERKSPDPTKPGGGLKLPPGPRCYTDMELMAEVALRHVIQQESAARSCDPALKLRDRTVKRLMTRMHDEIVEKFAFNLGKYQDAHEARHKRWYGPHWERALQLERQREMQNFLKDLWLLPGSCANMRKELEIILNSGWHYLNAKLNFEVEHKRPTSRMCKPGG